MTRLSASLAAAVLVLLAGCAGASLPTGSDGGGSCASSSFVLGGQQNQLSDFEHLNVTITKITLKRKSASTNKRVVKDIEDRRVDLTEWQGRNVTILENASVPDGTYKKAFLSVTNVSGTLTDGTDAKVSLRRDRLKVKKRFEVSGSESLTFEASPKVVTSDGGYVVKPLLAKSGSGCSCC